MTAGVGEMLLHLNTVDYEQDYRSFKVKTQKLKCFRLFLDGDPTLSALPLSLALSSCLNFLNLLLSSSSLFFSLLAFRSSCIGVLEPRNGVLKGLRFGVEKQLLLRGAEEVGVHGSELGTDSVVIGVGGRVMLGGIGSEFSLVPTSVVSSALLSSVLSRLSFFSVRLSDVVIRCLFILNCYTL